MKKLFIAVALFMGLGTSVVVAANMNSGVELISVVNDYKPIKVEELPQAVQDAIKKDYSEFTIKEVFVDEELKTYKVVLTDKEGAESTVVFNEKGEVSENEEAQE